MACFLGGLSYREFHSFDTEDFLYWVLQEGREKK
jgi:hypothetical protein